MPPPKLNPCPVQFVIPIEIIQKLIGDKSAKFISAKLDLKSQYLVLEISQKNFQYRFQRGSESLRVSLIPTAPFKLE